MRLARFSSPYVGGAPPPPPSEEEGGVLAVWGGGGTAVIGQGVENQLAGIVVPQLEIGLTDVVAMQTGLSQHFMKHAGSAQFPAGAISGWGKGLFGNLGLGTRTDIVTPTLIGLLSTDPALYAPEPPLPGASSAALPSPVKQMVCHSNFSGCVLENGWALAWGGAGGLAIAQSMNASGSTTNSRGRPSRMEHPPVGPLSNIANRRFVEGVVEMRAGIFTIMVRKTDNTLWRTGVQPFGGKRPYMEYESMFQPYEGQIAQFRVAEQNVLLLLTDGTIRICGANKWGQLCTGYTEAEENAPNWASTKAYSIGDLVCISNGTTVYQATQTHAKGDGQKPDVGTGWAVWRTGVPHRSLQEITQMFIQPTIPEKPGTGKPYKVIDLALNPTNGYVLLENGQVMGWGQNTMGQIGDGTSKQFQYKGNQRYTEVVTTPTYVKLEGGGNLGSVAGEKIVQIDTDGGPNGGQIATEQGDAHVGALTENGFVYGWGGNKYHAIGNGDESGPITNPFLVLYPSKLPGIANATYISIAESHGAALLSSGTPPTSPPVEAVPNSGDRGIVFNIRPTSDITTGEWNFIFRRVENEPNTKITAYVKPSSNQIEIMTVEQSEWGGEEVIRKAQSIVDVTSSGVNAIQSGTVMGDPIGVGPHGGKLWQLSQPTFKEQWELKNLPKPATLEFENPVALKVGQTNEPATTVKVPVLIASSSPQHVAQAVSGGVQKVELTEAVINEHLFPNLGDANWPDGLPWKNASSMLEVEVVLKIGNKAPPETSRWIEPTLQRVQPNHMPAEVPVLIAPPWLTQEPVIVNDPVYGTLHIIKDARWRVNGVEVPASSLSISHEWARRTESEFKSNPKLPIPTEVIPGATQTTYAVTEEDCNKFGGPSVDGVGIEVQTRASNGVGRSNPIPGAGYSFPTRIVLPAGS